jgi:molecular chaperone GrpE
MMGVNMEQGKDADEGKEATPDDKKKRIEAERKTTESEDKLNFEALKSSLEEKNKLAEEYYDRLLRTQAEFENYKKRTDKELTEFKIYANAQLVKDLLQILDDFQNALSTEEKGSDDNYIKGFELIFKNFYGMLEKEGLCIINPTKEKFDPWEHEAVEIVPSDEHSEHTVLDVIQPGYKFRDKILRPAKVRVSTIPGNEEKSEEGVEEDLDEVEGEDKHDVKDKDKNITEEND